MVTASGPLSRRLRADANGAASAPDRKSPSHFPSFAIRSHLHIDRVQAPRFGGQEGFARPPLNAQLFPSRASNQHHDTTPHLLRLASARCLIQIDCVRSSLPRRNSWGEAFANSAKPIGSLAGFEYGTKINFVTKECHKASATSPVDLHPVQLYTDGCEPLFNPYLINKRSLTLIKPRPAIRGKALLSAAQ